MTKFSRLRKVAIYFLTALGVNPRMSLSALKALSKFFEDKRQFHNMGGNISSIRPMLHDFYAEAGANSGEYFHHDLLVAQYIFENGPRRHLDIGSRIDGFVAHVASFRQIEVIDVRPLDNDTHPNIVFSQWDMSLPPNMFRKVDSLSCLNSLEHFGLGRYSDKVDPMAHTKAFKNMLSLIDNNGLLYISFPVGPSHEVVFNANRRFHPLEIFEWSEDFILDLIKFDFVDEFGKLFRDVKIENIVDNKRFGCGLYTIRVSKKDSHL